MIELEQSRLSHCRFYAMNESLFGQSHAQLNRLMEEMQVQLNIRFDHCYLILTGLPRRCYMERIGMGRADLLVLLDELRVQLAELEAEQSFACEIAVLNYDYSKRFVLAVSPAADAFDIGPLARQIDSLIEQRYRALAPDKPDTTRNITAYSEHIDSYTAYQQAFDRLRKLYDLSFFLRECGVLTAQQARARQVPYSMVEAERMLTRFSDLLFLRDVDGALDLLGELLLDHLKKSQDRALLGEVLVLLKRRLDDLCLILGVPHAGEIGACLDAERFLCIEELYASICGLTRRLLSGTNIPPLRLDGLSIRAIRYIRKNYHRPLDLTDIANHLHVNSAYLSHVFKSEMRVGISQYIMRIRMEQAQRLLRETDLKIAQVAQHVGIADPRYFNTVFKRAVGCTPTAYRAGRKL